MTTRGWREHDHSSDYQVCRDCGLRTGAGVSSDYDEQYFAGSWDPAECPRCGGPMGVDHPIEAAR